MVDTTLACCMVYVPGLVPVSDYTITVWRYSEVDIYIQGDSHLYFSFSVV